jgi:hypothetical protein
MTLPNSLPRSPRVDISMSRNGMHWFYLFCANCGTDGGRVLETDLNEQYAFYLCNSCAEKYGEIDGMTMVPDEVAGVRRD